MDTPNVPSAPPAYTGAERRSYDQDEWRNHVDKRLDEGVEAMLLLRADISDNTETTLQIQADTGELVSLLKSFQGAFSVLESIAKLARPLGFIAAAVAAFIGLWTAAKSGFYK